jgi:hypothetical protein
LAIAGEQGSAKTVLSKLLRAMIDPSVAPVRALPRDERELFIAASNGHVLAFDNLSGLPPWLSDTLCRLTSAVLFRPVGCSPIRTKFCLRPPAPSFSTASRMSSPAPILPTALSY